MGDNEPRDPAVDSLGISTSRADDGAVVAKMVVTGEMLNSHGVCHGGIIFLLADAVFDRVTNGAVAEDETAFAANATIDFVRAGRVGDKLTATGSAKGRWGRTTLVDVTVRNETDVVAHFRGQTRTVKKR